MHLFLFISLMEKYFSHNGSKWSFLLSRISAVRTFVFGCLPSILLILLSFHLLLLYLRRTMFWKDYYLLYTFCWRFWITTFTQLLHQSGNYIVKDSSGRSFFLKSTLLFLEMLMRSTTNICVILKLIFFLLFLIL